MKTHRKYLKSNCVFLKNIFIFIVVKQCSSSPTATFLRVADDIASPSTSEVFPNVTIQSCGMRCFKAGFDNCLGFQWRPAQNQINPQDTNSVDDTTNGSSSSNNCTRAPLVGTTNSYGKCDLLQCIPNPSSVILSEGTQMYFFRGKTQLDYGSIKAPPSYSMGCTYAYKIYDKIPMAYSDAESQCQMDGGKLVMIKSLEEHEFIISKILSGEGYWMGLTDRQEEGTWTHADGSVPEYTNWDAGQPNNFLKEDEDQDCSMLFQEKWNDNQCSTRLKFICQIVFLEL